MDKQDCVTKDATITIVLFTLLDGATVTNLPASISKLFSETLILQCTAVGLPIPTISWLKDNQIVPTSPRVTIENSTTNDNAGNVVSILIISQLMGLDEGEYSCKAENTLPAGLSQDISTTVLNITESLWMMCISYSHIQ